MAYLKKCVSPVHWWAVSRVSEKKRTGVPTHWLGDSAGLQGFGLSAALSLGPKQLVSVPYNLSG